MFDKTDNFLQKLKSILKCMKNNDTVTSMKNVHGTVLYYATLAVPKSNTLQEKRRKWLWSEG